MMSGSLRRKMLIAVAACLYYSGLVACARWFTRRSGRQLVILNYHRATGGDLPGHWLYLQRHYRIMHAEAALEELFAPRKNALWHHHKPTPLVLTFDDGYRDNYTYGFALAQALHIPFTIYLIPGYLDSGAYFWWLEGKRLVERAQAKVATFVGRTYDLEDAKDRIALARYIDAQARFALSVAQREKFLAQARTALAVPPEATDDELASLPLTWDEVHEMDQSGWVSFGAHTMHHPILSYLSNIDEARHEIRTCKHVLEKKLGHPVRSFAYPVGQSQHLSPAIVKLVQKAGFSWALTTKYGMNTPGDNPYLLRRVEVDVDQHWLVIAAEVAGLWGFFARLRWLPFIRQRFTNAAC